MGAEYNWFGGMWFMPLIGMPIFLLILFSIFNKNSNQNRESAIEILKRRYSNGEISKNEFDQMKKDIS